MTFHTKRSPSQAKRFLACPGALALCNSLSPEHQNQAGIAAQMGTAAHGLAERCLKEGGEPETYRGRIIELVGEDEQASILKKGAKVPGPGRVFFEVDSDMIDGVTVLTTYVRKRCKELGVKESELQLETRTNPLPERDDTSGTADVTLDAWPTVLELIDYKNGWNVVEADTEQLSAYLLGKAIESEFSHEDYCATVVQPNAPHDDGRVRSIHVSKKALLDFQKTYRAGIQRCEEAEGHFDGIDREDSDTLDHWTRSYLKAGDHCLFCDAQAVCPARAKLAQKDAKADFAEEPRELALPQQADAVANILRWAPSLEALIKAAELYAQRSMESGHKIPGFKLVRGRSNRKLREDKTEAQIVKEVIGGKFVKDVSLLYTPPKLISGPQMEKLVPSKLRDKFNELFLEKPEGRLTVAPEGDPRPAITSSAADDFADADEEDFG